MSWGDGIYKTTDAGKTWTNVGLMDSKHIGRIVWGVPIVLSVLAAGGLAWFLRRITRFPGAASEGGSESADERDRLDEELAALD